MDELSPFLYGFEVEDPFQDVPLILPEPILPTTAPCVNGDSVPAPCERTEDCEIQSDMLLNYISQMLMDEDMEAKTCMYQECSALQATMKPFYDILGEKYPPSPDRCIVDGHESPDSMSDCTGDSNYSQDCGSNISSRSNRNSSSGSDSNWISGHVDCTHQNELVSPVSTLSISFSNQSCLNSPMNDQANVVEHCREASVGSIGPPEISDKSQMLQFQREGEESKKFNLPLDGFPVGLEQELKEFFPNSGIVIDLESNGLSVVSKPSVKELFPVDNLLINSEPNGLPEASNPALNCIPSCDMVNLSSDDSAQESMLQASKIVQKDNLLYNLQNDSLLRDLQQDSANYLLNSRNVLELERTEPPHDVNLVVRNRNSIEDGIEPSDVEPSESDDQNESRRHKNRHREDKELDISRRCKHSAISSSSEAIRSEIFDQVLLCREGKFYESATNLREAMEHINGKNGHSKRSNGSKTRGKKQGKSEVVDLRTILIHCAQVVATGDFRSANQLLKRIRQHSSSCGNGTQRLAHWFEEGLEARLSGTGGQIYTALSAKRTSAANILKAYQLYLAACPFKKLSHYFSNQTIFDVAENVSKLHIIDFGILYGFQWPSFIQRLSGRPGGPPKLRITGIDFPQPGFKPAERIEETGQRLSEYARMFNVPFKYKAIASKWENVKIEDLDLDDDEVLVVNCLYRMRNLFDETVVVDCPRNIVLNKIQKMKPKIFILGVVNGAYNAPFFPTRFREALFYFSALFDMLETNAPRDHPERILIEREIFGREILNVVACEGSERVERPETYKQWQVRNQRAGFKQLPLKKVILNKITDKVREIYHKDFVVDEDSGWLLQGWKGRILQALSTWVPANRH